MKKNINKKAFVSYVISTICFSGVIGIALKFIMLFDNWVYFPFFPNIFDSIFLISSAIWLFLPNIKNRHKYPKTYY